MGILEALLNAEYPKTEIILNHKDYKRMTKKEITATIKGTDVIDFNGEWVNVAQLIKTSEELTAENSRLLLEVDDMSEDISHLLNQVSEEKQNTEIYRAKNIRRAEELASIKSTRLYKFFKWLGVW